MVRQADRKYRRRARARARLAAEAPEHRFDETRVDLACAGWPAAGLTAQERVEALERLYRRGLSVQEIATRLGLPAWVVQERVAQYQTT
jgi:DNA-binding NarL/FixJ family response regulator